MNIDAAYPSKYLKSSDLQGRTVKVTIRTVLMEAIGQASTEQKPILYFQGKEKGMVLNKTNAQAISHFYGQDTDHWTGRELELFTIMTDFQGRPVEGLRVRVPPMRVPAPVRAPEPPPPVSDSYGAQMPDDEIPF